MGHVRQRGRRYQGRYSANGFVKARLAIFIDGCFWHECPIHGNIPKANSDYWANKWLGNRKRDLNVSDELRLAGWQVIRIWEHTAPEAGLKLVKATLAILAKHKEHSTSIISGPITMS